MSVRSISLIVAALVLIAGTVFAARSWLDSQRVDVAQPQVEKQVATEVLVARADLPTGIFINEQHLRWQTWPDDDIPESYYTKGVEQADSIHGSVVRRPIAHGQPIIRSQIVRPGERGFLAAVLKPGYRAVSTKISAATGISGLVFPGDRVDILLTHKVGKGKRKGGNRVTETILTNVRVLALDQQTNDQTGEPRLAKTVTFELTPKQAEILAVVDQMGKLSLSLRSLAKDDEELEHIVNNGESLEDPEPTPGRTYTLDAEASLLTKWPGAKGNTVTVIRGTSAQTQGVSKSPEGAEDDEASNEDDDETDGSDE